MIDLEKMVIDLLELPDKIYTAALTLADLENNYETLKEEIKHKRAVIMNCYGEKSQAKAEMMAYASDQYKSYLRELTEARLAYLKASAFHEFLLKQYDALKSCQIVEMARMKLV